MAILDDTFTSVVRLRICAYLSGCEAADFKAVQEFCDLTQPNLSKNLTALAERGYVDIAKVADKRYTTTRLRLTQAGQAALNMHVAALQEIVATARAHRPATAAPLGSPSLPHELTQAGAPAGARQSPTTPIAPTPCLP